MAERWGVPDRFALLAQLGALWKRGSFGGTPDEAGFFDRGLDGRMSLQAPLFFERLESGRRNMPGVPTSGPAAGT